MWGGQGPSRTAEPRGEQLINAHKKVVTYFLYMEKWTPFCLQGGYDTNWEHSNKQEILNENSVTCSQSNSGLRGLVAYLSTAWWNLYLNIWAFFDHYRNICYFNQRMGSLR
jgi:hypothetical protein